MGSINYALWQPFATYNLMGNNNLFTKKWHLNSYAGISAGYGFFNGAGTTFLSAPVGLQLSRPLNNNFVAFGSVSVAPTIFNLSNPSFYHSYPAGNYSNAYSIGMNSRIEMGLMYVNDARTFSISGSIGVERSSYPGNPYPAQTTTRRKQ